LKAAIAISNNQVSRTLGSAEQFVLLSDNAEEQFVCDGKIPAFLKRHGVQLLICNGIGNCMMDLLSTMNINVIPGVTGKWEDAAMQYRAGTLKSGEKYSCTDHGQSCGACAGTF
jgi:predicted Fe-Mo cluster-binding NifX family protein